MAFPGEFNAEYSVFRGLFCQFYIVCVKTAILETVSGSILNLVKGLIGITVMANDAFSLCGKFLIAMPSIGDHRFERTVIFLCAHSEEGAMGFIVNKTMESPDIPDFLSQLQIIEDSERDILPEQLVAQSLHLGGPVEPGRGFVLHSPEFKSDSTLEITEGICLTATLEILRAIALGRGPKKYLLALGYAGWSGGQVEEEIASNGWLTADANQSLVFDVHNHQKYERSLKLLGVDPTLLSSSAGHA